MRTPRCYLGPTASRSTTSPATTCPPPDPRPAREGTEMTNPTAGGAAGPAQAGEWGGDLAARTGGFTGMNFGLRSATGHVPLVSASVTVGPGGQPVSVRA